MNLTEGQQAPEFSGTTQDGKSINLSDYASTKNVVLYFYPKDDTPGCTIEANEFTNLISEFEASGTIIIGVSADSVDSHIQFIEKFGIKFNLFADTSKTICDQYGAWGECEWNGKHYMGIKRSTFVIDKSGALHKAMYDVKAKGHAQEILDIVKKLP
ncbi:MAG: peroxiredoxin Q/BCP [Gammaproteobacteria bacterium]|jgi:peroxiredoxin Q/BCP